MDKNLIYYWDNRYKGDGNSGAGSYGKSAKYKADIVNKCISKYHIKTIADFGCGDGNQISYFSGFINYCGYDISPYIVNKCRKKFSETPNITFTSDINELPLSDLCLSLDVIYHVVDKDDYEVYLTQLFQKSLKFVLIYSTNYNDIRDELKNREWYHAYHRKFSDWVDKNINNFKLINIFENPLRDDIHFWLYTKNFK
jgi:hypothetical protein